MQARFLRDSLVLFLLALPGSTFADDTYAVTKTDAVTAVGDKGVASVTVTAKKGWHLNTEAPFTLKMAESPSVRLEKAKLARADLAAFTSTSARFDVAMTPSKTGRTQVEAELGFVVCQEDACRPIREKLSLTVDAAAEKAEPGKKTGKKKNQTKS